MAISDWPAAERPREKLLDLGAGALSDAELLAIFLRTGARGLSAVDLARSLISEFGGLRGLLNADRQRICARRGLGEAKFVQLQACLEVARRHLFEELKRGEPIESPSAAASYLRARMRDYRREVFACLYLDNRHRVIAFEELFAGTVDSANVHPREVVRRALEHNAAALILAHNHPSGVAEPSRADAEITHRLKEALGMVGVRVLDHLIVGDDDPISLAERGLC